MTTEREFNFAYRLALCTAVPICSAAVLLPGLVFVTAVHFFAPPFSSQWAAMCFGVLAGAGWIIVAVTPKAVKRARAIARRNAGLPEEIPDD